MTPPSSPTDSKGPADLERILAILRRRAGSCRCLVVTAAAAVGFSLLQQKEYSASASLLFRNPGFAEDLFGTTSTPRRSRMRRAKLRPTQSWSDSRWSRQRTAKRLKGLSTDQIAAMVSVCSEGEAEFVSVSATSPGPSRRGASRTLLLASSSPSGQVRTNRGCWGQSGSRNESSRASPPAQRAGVRGESLSRVAEKLGVLASLQTGNAELVQPAELPTAPSSPKPVRNGILGVVLGLLLGLGLAFLFERLNRRLRDPEEAREAFGLPVLGTIPESKAIMASNEGTAAAELPFVENEAFRMLGASLRYFNVDDEMRSVLVTSDAAGVGKSTVAWNLARVAASSSKVVIVETDLRNPTLSPASTG